MAPARPGATWPGPAHAAGDQHHDQEGQVDHPGGGRPLEPARVPGQRDELQHGEQDGAERRPGAGGGRPARPAACAATPKPISHAPVAWASSGVSFQGHHEAACPGAANSATPRPSSTTACTASRP